MEIEILSTKDDSFRIISTSFGNKVLLPDEERVAQTEEVAQTEPTAPVLNRKPPTPAPLENSTGGHPFNPFGGTSWDDGKRGHKFD